jgi:hypothetical protein
VNNPALDDPRTVLHVLNYKAALPIILAMLMPDCPRPCSVKWLCRRAGVQSVQTARESLKYLAELGVAAMSLVQNKGWWQLTDRAYQLPLPAASLDASSQSQLPESSQSPAGASSQLPIWESSQSPDTEVGKFSPTVGVGKFSPPLHDDHDDDVVITVDLKQHHHHTDKHEVAEVGKFSPTPTSHLLERLGCDPPMPEKFAHIEAAVILAFYWSALPWAHTPVGFLRRRLEQGHEPPGEHLELARFWLALDEDGRDNFRSQFDHAMLPVHRISDLVNEFDLSQAAAKLTLSLRELKVFDE